MKKKLAYLLTCLSLPLACLFIILSMLARASAVPPTAASLPIRLDYGGMETPSLIDLGATVKDVSPPAMTDALPPPPTTPVPTPPASPPAAATFSAEQAPLTFIGQAAESWGESALIKVLQIYPDGHNTRNVALAVYTWSDLFHVDVLPVSTFNTKTSVNDVVTVVDPISGETVSHPISYYDVLYFGVADQYAGQDLVPQSAQVTRQFAQLGKGILFTHDTVSMIECPSGPVCHPNFDSLKDVSGLTGDLQQNVVWFTHSKLVAADTSHPVLHIPFELPSWFQTRTTHWYGQNIRQGDQWYNGTDASLTADYGLYTQTYYNPTYRSFSAFFSYGHTEAVPLEWEAKAMINAMYYTYHGGGFQPASIRAEPASVLADGTSTSTVTLVLRDAAGRCLPNQQVRFESTLPGVAFTPSSGWTDANGVFTAQASSITAGTAIITARNLTSGQPIPASASVTFTPVGGEPGIGQPNVGPIVVTGIRARLPLDGTYPALGHSSSEASSLQAVADEIFRNQIDVAVDWRGYTPERVDFVLNGEIHSVAASAQGASYELDMSRDLHIGTNELVITAHSSDNAKLVRSAPHPFSPILFELPGWLAGLAGAGLGDWKLVFFNLEPTLVLDLTFPPSELDATLDGFGFGGKTGVEDLQLFGKLILPLDGSRRFDIKGGIKLRSETKDRRRVSPKLIVMGVKPKITLEVDFFIAGTGIVTPQAVFILDEEGIRGGFGAGYEAEWKKSLLVVLQAHPALSPLVGLIEKADSLTGGRLDKWLQKYGYVALIFSPHFIFEGTWEEDSLLPKAIQGGFDKCDITGDIRLDAKVAEIRFYAGLGGSAVLGGPPAEIVEASFYGKGGIYARALWFEDSAEARFGWKYPDGQARVFLDEPIQHARWTLIGHTTAKDYAIFCPQPSTRQTFAPTMLDLHPMGLATQTTITSILVSNVYTYTEPSLSIDPVTDSALLLWIHDVVTKPVGQGHEIYFSQWNGTSWSTPAGVMNDDWVDGAPQVAWAGDGNGVAVWHRLADTLPITATLDVTTANKIEIATAVYSPTLDSWSPVSLLTDNAALDMTPRLARNANGDLLAVWRQNAAGLLVGDASDPDRIMAAFYASGWTTPTVAVDNIPGLLDLAAGYGNSAATLAYTRFLTPTGSITPTLQLFASTWNGSAWLPPQQLTDDDLGHTNPQVVYNPLNQPLLVWQAGDTLRLHNLSTGAEVSLALDPDLVVDEFRLLHDAAGNLAAVFTGQQAGQRDLFVAFYDQVHELWGNPTRLTNDRASEAYPAPALDSTGRLLMGYAATAMTSITHTTTITATGEVITFTIPTEGQTDLVTLSHEFTYNLTLTDDNLVVSNDHPTPGSSVVLSATVRNSGDLVLDNVSVAFYDGDPSLGGTLIETATLPVPLAAGFTSTLTSTYTVPLTGGVHQLFAIADPDDLIAESDETDNTASLTAFGPDLELVDAGVDYWGSSQVGLVTLISNIGTTASPTTTITYHWDAITGTLAITDTTPTLAAGAVVTITTPWDYGTLAEGSYTLVAVVNEEQHDFPEADTSNNALDLVLNVAPDLMVSPLYFWVTQTVDSQLVITGTVFNDGSVAAYNVQATVYAGNPFTVTGQALFTDTVPTLLPASYAIITGTWTLGPSGWQELYLWVDPTNAISETTEANNLAITLNPPPNLDSIEHLPSPNPESDDVVTIRAQVSDEVGISGVTLKWLMDGTPQADLTMYDDGAHDDHGANDGWYGVQIGPFPVGTVVEYQVEITDIGSSTAVAPQNPVRFESLEPFVKTADILFVPDSGGDDTSWFRSYYENTLTALEYEYNVWDTDKRGEIDSATLNQYIDGAVIWATPSLGFVTNSDTTRNTLQDFLDNGGNLCITGQDIGPYVGGTSFYQDYLHASFVQNDVGLTSLSGVSGDRIGDGLSFSIVGGDGANNQYQPDEIDPVSPAVAVFTYDMTVAATLVESVRPVATKMVPEGGRPGVTPTPAAGPGKESDQPTGVGVAASATGIISSGTAGLRVDTGTYKVVYFAFGFEGISNASDRAAAMDRVLIWLLGILPPPTQLSPANDSTVAEGNVPFTWTSVTGATDYQIQIDATTAFTSPVLISDTVASTSYTATLPLGTWYWRVRAFPDGEFTTAWRVIAAEPVVQVTTANSDNDPAIFQTADGKLWAFFQSYRDGGFSYLWYQTSTDGGTTWSEAVPFTQIYDDDYAPSAIQTADGKLWVVWYSYRTGNGDLWFKTSPDNGATWSGVTQLTTDTNTDCNPNITQAADGKLWVVWYSGRSGNWDIWYKKSSDDGVTWSAEVQLTTDPNGDLAPTITQAADGKLWVVWERNGRLWYRTSSDGGSTWSAEAQIDGNCCYYNPSLVRAGEGTLWLAGERYDADIWYWTSADNGASWSTPTQLTRYVAGDWEPSLASLADGHVGIAWHSERGQQWWSNVWYGIFGVREDINPAPFVGWIWHEPNWPDATNAVTISVYARDESPGLNIELVWSKDGVPQSNLTMYDDGTHGDATAGDDRHSVQIGPFPAGTLVQYQAQATDSGGNTILHPPAPYSFRVVEPFVKTTDILFVPDYGGNSTDWFQPYFTNALDSLGYSHDIWDTGLRGAPNSATLDLYTSGVVIWASPDWGYFDDNDVRPDIEAYLDAGGKLFITGQNVAQNLNGTTLLSDYLHASYVQNDTDLYALNGTTGDPIGDGLALGISGGDGANNQYDTDEIDPISPAVTVFTYDTAATTALVARPVRPEVIRPEREGGKPGAIPTPTPWGEPQEPLEKSAEAELTAGLQGIISSGTGGLRVDTGTYKVVFFSFGFEGINSQGDRAAVMERVLAWLQGVPPRPTQLSPADGSAVPVGDVTFTWSSVVGASGYQIQIDTTAAFTSTDLISDTVTSTSYTTTLTLGTWHWRGRALPDGLWTTAWELHAAGPLVQVTTDTGSDYDPSIVQAADGTLWVAWYSYSSGNGDIWYKTSTDGGAIWSAATQLTTDTSWDYAPAITQAADGTLWVVWYSYRSGNYDIWYETSSDGGVTWSAATQLTTDTGSDYDPAIAQTTDGTLWVVWYSWRSGNADIWGKYTTDGGQTWSAVVQLTTDSNSDYRPAITSTSDGKLWLVWYSYRTHPSRVWYMTSADNGATWSPPAALSDGSDYVYDPTIAQTLEGTLRVGWYSYGPWDQYAYYSLNTDLWTIRSTDAGATWSAPVRFTRFTGYDEQPSFAAGPGGNLAIAWQSDRATNHDIWFGVMGQREDVNPPPHIDEAVHDPAPNPDNTQTVTIRALLSDNEGIANATVIWTRDGGAQPDLTLHDDGAHNDYAAGDGWYGAQLGPFPTGTVVDYHLWLQDTSGNAVEGEPTYWRYPTQFVVQPQFVPTASLLLVADDRYRDPDWFSGFYTDALEALSLEYDLWNTYVRGVPDSAILAHYNAVIWAMAEYGMLVSYPEQDVATANLQGYLDGGGKLFISGQSIDYIQYTNFYQDYLHASFVQDDPGLRELEGVAGDPISDGLSFSIAGGDGADNQWSPDEIDPVSPAVTILTYNGGVLAQGKLRLPEGIEGREPFVEPALSVPAGRPMHRKEPNQAGLWAELQGVVSSGSGAIRVDTGTYKVIYFAFGFEAINPAADRQLVIERVLDWTWSLFGDLDFNCVVNVADVQRVASRWRMTDEDPDWNPRYDLDGDGIITVVDIMKVVANWGATC